MCAGFVLDSDQRIDISKTFGCKATSFHSTLSSCFNYSFISAFSSFERVSGLRESPKLVCTSLCHRGPHPTPELWVNNLKPCLDDARNMHKEDLFFHELPLPPPFGTFMPVLLDEVTSSAQAFWGNVMYLPPPGLFTWYFVYTLENALPSAENSILLVFYTHFSPAAVLFGCETEGGPNSVGGGYHTQSSSVHYQNIACEICASSAAEEQNGAGHVFFCTHSFSWYLGSWKRAIPYYPCCKLGGEYYSSQIKTFRFQATLEEMSQGDGSRDLNHLITPSPEGNR